MHFDFVPNTLLASGHGKPSIYAGFRAFVQMSRCFQGTNTYLSITIIIIKKLIEKIVYNTRKKEDKNLTISAESISKKFLDLCL